MLFLEKEKFNKILILFTLLMFFILVFSVSPVHASVSVRDDSVNYLVTNDGIEEGNVPGTQFITDTFKKTRVEMLSTKGYRVYFDAEFSVDFNYSDLFEFNTMYDRQLIDFVFTNLNFTGFKWMYFAAENGGDPNVLHPFFGYVNLIDYGQGSFNSLKDFDYKNFNYEIIVEGKSLVKPGDLVPVDREVKIYENVGRFPISSYTNPNGPGKNISYTNGALGAPMSDFINDDYYSFSPISVKLAFRDVYFDWDPYRIDSPDGLWNAGPTPGYYVFDHLAEFVGLSYDLERVAPLTSIDYKKIADLKFYNQNTAIPPIDGGGGAGNIFSIIPMIMVSIFSFFWVIGSVEIGGIAGFTLVSVVTFFVGFMLVKFIIGLFKGGGD